MTSIPPNGDPETGEVLDGPPLPKPFAEHIEDGIDEIIKPAAADMLELAQTFHAQTNSTFRSAIRLDSGEVQLRYEETVDTKAGHSGQMQVPATFELAVAPFVGEDPYKLVARFRHRSAGGQLKMGYKLERPDAVVRDALTKIHDRLADRFPAVFIGEPGA